MSPLYLYILSKKLFIVNKNSASGWNLGVTGDFFKHFGIEILLFIAYTILNKTAGR